MNEITQLRRQDVSKKVIGGVDIWLIQITPEYLPTGLREATGSEHDRPMCNDGLRGLTKADSLAA